MIPPVATDAHEAALDLGAAPVTARHHALRPFVAPCLALAQPRFARGRVGLGLGGRRAFRYGTLARL